MPHVRRLAAFVPVAGFLAAAVFASGCDVVINSMEGGKARAEQVWTRTYTLAPAGAEVDISNTNGPVEIEAVDGTTLDVRATIRVRGGSDEDAKAGLKKVEMSEEASPARVRIEAKYSREMGRRVDVTYVIKAPRGAKVRLGTVNGHIHLKGAFAAVKAETTNGRVEGEGLGSDVSVATTNGEIHLALASVGGDGLTAETTNGGIDVLLPDQAKATLSARCVNGSIRVAEELRFEKTGESSRRRLDGTINGGGSAVRLETVNGSVHVGRS
jgi:hypothetical protein